MLRKVPVAAIAQVVGLALLTIGAALVYLPAGWIVGGLSLVVLGLALERG